MISDYSILHFKLLHLFSFILFASVFIIINTYLEQLSLPGCPRKCGNLTIPFPFGMNSGCYFDDSFHIICNNSYEPPKPFLGSAQVAGISLHGKIRILKSSSSSSSSSSVLVVIRWAAGEASCRVARNNVSRYACRSQHSRCQDSSLGRGHVCRCLPGFHGNPYLPNGCQDIDECASNPCEGVCINMAGSFKCYCPKGSVGDGRKNGTGCHPQDEIMATSSPFSYSPIGIFLVVPFLVVTWIAWTGRQKKLQTHREEMFEQNGGNLLLSRWRKTQLTLYTDQEMKSITSNYNAPNLMQGKRCCPGPGTFYRGTLLDDDRTEVAVVNVKRVPQSQIKHFVDQLIFLSQPLEKNVMRIMGCCLETLSPLIVYQLHGDGATTLFDCIHGEARFSCEMRVKAAAGVARGLAHFHKNKFVHGNICSANILMDTSFNANIFYAAGSNLISPPPGQNNKSDVYSFGVILVELLTGGRSLSPSRDENDNMAGRLHEILDEEMAGKGEVVREMAVLAVRCLNVKPSKRPKMKKVEAKLRKLMMPRE